MISAWRQSKATLKISCFLLFQCTILLTGRVREVCHALTNIHSTGVLNAFFFASPVAQPGSSLWYLLSGAADWESPALPSSLMCENWCDDENCHWEESWATMHIYLSSAWEELTCPGGSGPVGRSCTMV